MVPVRGIDAETFAGLRDFVLEDAGHYENGPVIPVGYVLDYWVKAANESDAVAEHLRRQYRQRGARLMTRE